MVVAEGVECVARADGQQEVEEDKLTIKSLPAAAAARKEGRKD